jgi:hypothetical protein
VNWDYWLRTPRGSTVNNEATFEIENARTLVYLTSYFSRTPQVRVSETLVLWLGFNGFRRRNKIFWVELPLLVLNVKCNF